MNKLILILPLFFLTMCGEAPVTPPAGACSLPLDGSPANCPDPDEVFVRLPREEMKGEIDVWNPQHFIQIEQMFIRNARRKQIEKNMTQPSDAINSALDSFWEETDGSNASTESEELLQLSSDGNQPSS